VCPCRHDDVDDDKSRRTDTYVRQGKVDAAPLSANFDLLIDSSLGCLICEVPSELDFGRLPKLSPPRQYSNDRSEGCNERE
jgi:hypothetical protein